MPSGPAARISTGANIFLVGVSLQPEAEVFCELDLPAPASFRSVRCMNIKNVWFPSPPPSLKFASQIALVHVLSYDFEDAASLALVDKSGTFPWNPIRTESGLGSQNRRKICSSPRYLPGDSRSGKPTGASGLQQ